MVLNDQADVKNDNQETAGIHKPYVLSPSFVFSEVVDEEIVTNESFVNSQIAKINHSIFDLENVVVSYTNENYVPPSALPNLPPLLFHTFKKKPKPKVKLVKPNVLNPDSIEIAPE